MVGNNLVSTNENDEANVDFTVVRNNLQNLIVQGQIALGAVADLAEQSQNARLYEVLAQLLRTNVDANKELLNTHRQRKEIRNNQAPSSHTVTHNKNLIIASSAEVLEMIQKNLASEAKQLEEKK